MKKLLVIFFIFILFDTYALRVEKPAILTDLSDSNQITMLNETLERFWDITNGRYNIDSTTVNPDGATQGDVGDVILLITGGNYYLEINVDGSTTWRGVQLTDLP
ncbi:hypothetical protein KKF61_07980 [Patescibacteria group bacterium]|nr:hypothetical protein [Patescibacteria group bacterium]